MGAFDGRLVGPAPVRGIGGVLVVGGKGAVYGLCTEEMQGKWRACVCVYFAHKITLIECYSINEVYMCAGDGGLMNGCLAHEAEMSCPRFGAHFNHRDACVVNVRLWGRMYGMYG